MCIRDRYRDDFKKEGGYSLELINPGAACQGSENWIASDNLSGGTPGQQNSVFNFQFDESQAKLISVFPVDPTTLVLEFDKVLDLNIAQVSGNYQILDGPEVSVVSILGTGRSLELSLGSSLEEGVIYSLELLELVDCLGQAQENIQQITFALPAPALAGDLVINEILFNPSSGGVDFVEFCNVSEKVIDASTLLIGNITDSEIDIVNVEVQSLIFPNDFFVMTPSELILSEQYEIVNPQFLHENELPSFDDDSGNVTLFTSTLGVEEIIDAFDYDKDFHNALLVDENGVSLERLSKEATSQDEGNWHSSAAANGFASPTYENSQRIVLEETDGAYTLINKTFSPDQDGFEDFLQIRFNNLDPGQLATIKIYDRVGREVNVLANNELVSNSGAFLWDGSDADGNLVRMGIYVLWMQVFSPQGEVEVFKEAVVVAKQLD